MGSEKWAGDEGCRGSRCALSFIRQYWGPRQEPDSKTGHTSGHRPAGHTTVRIIMWCKLTASLCKHVSRISLLIIYWAVRLVIKIINNLNSCLGTDERPNWRCRVLLSEVYWYYDQYFMFSSVSLTSSLSSRTDRTSVCLFLSSSLQQAPCL